VALLRLFVGILGQSRAPLFPHRLEKQVDPPPPHPPPGSACVVLVFLLSRPCLPSGYGLVQEELLSPASMQYGLPSPLGSEPYWQEVSILECAPIATTEEDTLMEMSDVQVWPAGLSPSLVTVEDSSLDGSSRADDSEGATLSLPCSLGRPSSGASGASVSIMELEEEEEEEDEEEVEVEEEEAPQEPATLLAEWDRVRASGAVPKVNLNGQLGGQRLDGRRGEVLAAGGGGGGGVELGSVEGISVVAGQQVYVQRYETSGLSRSSEHNGDKRYVGDVARLKTFCDVFCYLLSQWRHNYICLFSPSFFPFCPAWWEAKHFNLT